MCVGESVRTWSFDSVKIVYFFFPFFFFVFFPPVVAVRGAVLVLAVGAYDLS